MANTWGSNPIILDTQNDDANYTAANDVVKGGTKYSTQWYKIRKIVIKGNAANDDIVLNTCTTSSLAAGKFLDLLNLNAVDLNKVVDLDGLMVQGICPTTIGASCVVYIYIY